MWSGKLWLGFRASLAASFAIALGGCVTSSKLPPWFSPTMMEELRTQQEYADFIAARYAGIAGDSSAAAAYYRRALESAPDDPVLLERATFATLASGDAREAIRIASEAKASVSEPSASAQLALIVDDIGAGRSRSALQRLKTADLGALNADLSLFLTSWLTAQDNVDKGLSVLTVGVTRRMLAGEHAAVQGLIHLGAGQDDKALEAFEQAQRLPVISPDLIASLNARLRASRGDLAGARKVIAEEVSENGRGSATDAVRSLIEAGEPVTRPKLSVRQGAAMIIYLVSATGIARSSPEIAAMRYSLALNLDPELAPARLSFADAFEQQDRLEDAVDVLREINANSPWRAEARIKEAWLLDKLDRPGEALVAADQALASSRRRDILIGAADLNRINGNFDRATRLYDEVVAVDAAENAPDWQVLFARASARNAAGDWKGAEADAAAALAIEPDRAEIQNFLGFAWVDRGEKVDEGMALIRKAAASRPDQGYIIDSLGWAYYRLGQYEKAIDNLERAAELSYSDPEILDHLGDAYWRVGRYVEARYQWEAALKLKPDQVREQSLRTKLEKGLPAAPTASLASRP